jgi:peptide/nickel transport system ATP-binding protein
MNKLEVRDLTVRFGFGPNALTAVDGISLQVSATKTLGLVGESGCGKSTVARAVVRLVRASSGRILLDGKDVAEAGGEGLKKLHARVQMVFQDPYASLNPRMTVGEAIEGPIKLYRRLTPRERAAEVDRLLRLVSLDPAAADRYPHEFSGGQRQRIAIARALAVQSELIILDEVTSSLDVSVQANILNLLKRLQRELGLAFLFISHNLSVVRYMSDTVAVMYLGRIVERAPVEELFDDPRHPYTRALIDSIPKLRAKGGNGRVHLSGEIPDPRHPPSGCRFRTRCPIGPNAFPNRRVCVEVDPHTTLERGDHMVACHFPIDALRRAEGATRLAQNATPRDRING